MSMRERKSRIIMKLRIDRRERKRHDGEYFRNEINLDKIDNR